MARPANAPPSESAKSATAAAPAGDPKGLTKLVLAMIWPYRKWLVIVFAAMMVEAAMSLAGPWPLKIVIDNVVGDHKLPEWLAWMKDLPLGHDRMALAAAAALALVLIAVVGAIAGYIDNYYTESVAQYVANDLRKRVYHHLQRLSLRYYDTHQTGNRFTNEVQN